jgi:hypothetical protein
MILNINVLKRTFYMPIVFYLLLVLVALPINHMDVSDYCKATGAAIQTNHICRFSQEITVVC